MGHFFPAFPAFFAHRMNDTPFEQAWIISLRLLAASPKSTKELARRLASKCFAEDIISKVVTKLENERYLNDEVLARQLLEKFTRLQPSGSKRILFELKRRGIPAAICNSVVSALVEDKEADRAMEIGMARWEKSEKLPLLKRKKKVFDYLLRRGFNYQQSRDIVEKLETSAEQL
ncbi:MAG: hypothetical protein A2Z83_05425 [Omnitrophica bacterium GWA2_52_8]|nr:MAG: hypothetical protein A2Z83_05425 [Omnitrophica bacterium GWA2_52_8]